MSEKKEEERETKSEKREERGWALFEGKSQREKSFLQPDRAVMMA